MVFIFVTYLKKNCSVGLSLCCEPLAVYSNDLFKKREKVFKGEGLQLS